MHSPQITRETLVHYIIQAWTDPGIKLPEYAYVDRTLKALNIEPGTFCTNYNERMTTKVNKDKCRKSTTKFKRQRIQKHLSSSGQTARKEGKEGTTYQTGIGLNLDVNTNSNLTKP